MQNLRTWNPDEWQTYVNTLLRLRFGADYVICPDKHGGDEGIEGFVRKQGLAFQCYAPQDTYRPKELYEKHRDKITEDLPKLIQHKEEFIKLFGPTKLKHWILIVPQHDSVETQKHGEKKAAEIRNANLPFIDAEFSVSTDTDDFFPVEKAQLRSNGLIPLNVSIPKVPQAAALEWASNNDVLVERLDGKLLKLRPTAKDQEVRKAREERIRQYIAANNFLDNLRRDYEEFWEKVVQCKEISENYLDDSFVQAAGPAEAYITEIKRVEQRLRDEVRVLSEPQSMVLARGFTAGWLLECSLDF